jgi:hypothetical protein
MEDVLSAAARRRVYAVRAAAASPLEALRHNMPPHNALLWTCLGVAVAAMAGCEHYRPLPLTSEAVEGALTPPSMAAVRVRAAILARFPKMEVGLHHTRDSGNFFTLGPFATAYVLTTSTEHGARRTRLWHVLPMTRS